MSDMQEIANRMKGQDHRATAHPIYIVQQKERIYGFEPGYSDSYVWVGEDGEQLKDSDFETERTREREEGEEPFDVDEWERVYFQDRWVGVQSFFSLIGAMSYIQHNKHNITSPRVYVGTANRNDEWQAVRTYLENLQRNSDDD